MPSLLLLLRTLLDYFIRFFTSVAQQPPPLPDHPAATSNDPDPPYPPEPSSPVSFPIKDLEYLSSRSYFCSFHYPFNVASVPLPSYASFLPSRPRILVCHDMAGGYLDDKWVQGGKNPDAYSIWHWYLMDVFVYFSHNLVSLPPPGWTNAAHRHGVKVLGTFLVEWDEGKVIADKLLLTKESAQMYADRLAELAQALKFDGWLLNFEVQLKPEQIDMLKEFISHLTKNMHASLPGSLVIWYDSVTKDGALRWQNQLNGHNKPFFDLCDGIFVNYTWQVNYPRISAAMAGERKFDVYMGIDVFGRGTYGGGQWNTNVALDLLKKDSVSAAIFAPGWVYENKEPPNFETAQNRWWGLIEKSWGILQHYPRTLPFYANFNQGRGYHFFIEGLQVLNEPWNNLTCQQFQPLIDCLADSSKTPIQMLTNTKDASYSGGGNLTFKGIIDDSAILTKRIFEGELSFGDVPAHISFSVRSDGNSLLGLRFWFSSGVNGERASVCVADKFLTTDESDEIVIAKKTMMNDKVWVIAEADVQKSGFTLNEIDVVCYVKSEPTENKPGILHGRKILNSNPTSGIQSPFDASLGHLSIQLLGQDTDFLPADAWVIEFQDIRWASTSTETRALSVKILWKLKDGCNSSFGSYNVYGEKLIKSSESNVSNWASDGPDFIGVAALGAYYVSDLEVPSGTTAIRFTVQVCRLDGTSQNLDESPTVELVVAG